jgi:hypothetical protein
VRRTAVEVASRLVGQHAGRLGHQRTRERDAPPFAARELARSMLAAMRESDAPSIDAARARAAMPASRRMYSGIATFSSAENSGSR